MLASQEYYEAEMYHADASHCIVCRFLIGVPRR